jgi:apolipoprotein N-acyltransferase
MYWDISWPWLTLGNAFARFPSWAQWYEYTGAFGGSLWILGVNFMFFEALQLYRKSAPEYTRKIMFALGMVVAPLLISFAMYFSYKLPDGTVEVAVVQPNFEPHFEKFLIPEKEQLERFIHLSDSIVTESTEYLVFPETSFGMIHLNRLEQDYSIDKLRNFTDKYPNLKLVTGASTYRSFSREDDHPAAIRAIPRQNDTLYVDVQNSALQIQAGEDIPVYFKSKLVPGAELFPFRKFMPFLKPIVDMLDGSLEGHTKQKSRTVFVSESGVVAPVICYESVYGSFVGEYIQKGANLIFIVTNDGWWDNTAGHKQHLQFASLRAIEHRRPIARSANTGISCFINERGDILQATKYEETIAISGKLMPGDKKTFYTQWGDLIARISLFLFLLSIALRITSKYRKN